MRTDPEDRGVFVRSLAARDRLGGLADIACPATVLLRALYDRVVVESVGVGQSEPISTASPSTVILAFGPLRRLAPILVERGIVEVPVLPS